MPNDRSHHTTRHHDGLDAEYRFGQPRVYLTPRELARLTILRSRLGDTHAERLAAAAGEARTGARA
jgi:hypothetical protein